MTFHPIYVDVDMLVSVAAALHSPSHSADPSTRSDSLPPGFDLKALLADVTGRAPARAWRQVVTAVTPFSDACRTRPYPVRAGLASAWYHGGHVLLRPGWLGSDSR